MKLRTLGSFALAICAYGQSLVDLGRQARNPDFSALPHTRPIQVGAAMPASCAVGELFFNSSSASANAVYACTSANTWTAVGSDALGSCTVSNNGLSCPGDIRSGTGANAGTLSLYEPVVNGNNAISITAPDSITTRYTLRLPASGPQAGQTLAFTQPDSNGIAQASWLTPGTGPSGSTSAISLYGTSGDTSNAVSIAAPSTFPASYTLRLPASAPLSGQNLTFAAPDTSGVAQGSWQTENAGQLSGGATLSAGPYATLLPGCTDGDMYLFTDSLYTLARCAAGVWTHFLDGKAIKPPSVLGPTTLVTGSQVTLNTYHGYEQLVATGGGTVHLRAFAAPVSTPYTQYLALRAPYLLDFANYRYWHVGFADPSGKSEVLTCGVGQATANGFWCRITALTASGSFSAQITSPREGISALSGNVIVALRDDGSLLHFGISSDANTYFEIGSVARTSYLSSPTRLVYGFENSAAGQTLALNFLGVF
jgi:hypothetical protein